MAHVGRVVCTDFTPAIRPRHCPARQSKRGNWQPTGMHRMLDPGIDRASAQAIGVPAMPDSSVTVMRTGEVPSYRRMRILLDATGARESRSMPQHEPATWPMRSLDPWTCLALPRSRPRAPDPGLSGAAVPDKHAISTAHAGG